MKKTYTKKQIAEAISYWNGRLNENTQSQAGILTVKAPDLTTAVVNAYSSKMGIDLTEALYCSVCTNFGNASIYKAIKKAFGDISGMKQSAFKRFTNAIQKSDRDFDGVLVCYYYSGADQFSENTINKLNVESSEDVVELLCRDSIVTLAGEELTNHNDSMFSCVLFAVPFILD